MNFNLFDNRMQRFDEIFQTLNLCHFFHADDTDDDNDGQPDDEDYVSVHHNFSRILIYFENKIIFLIQNYPLYWHF